MYSMLCSLQGDTQRMFISLCGKDSKYHKWRAEQHFQDIFQKLQGDKNLDNFAAHFDKHFNQKLTPRQCCEIIKFRIFSTVNPIKSIKTWINSSCNLFLKDILEIISFPCLRYGKLMNTRSEVYGVCHHNLRFHRFT